MDQTKMLFVMFAFRFIDQRFFFNRLLRVAHFAD